MTRSLWRLAATDLADLTHDTNRRWDLLAELRAETMTQLSQLLERVRLIKGIANTETSLLLATYR